VDRIEVLFWDVGGVLLTNGWDTAARARVSARFGLDPAEFGERHDAVVADFETGDLSLEAYLAHVVFHRPRCFRRDEFLLCMLAQSQPRPETLALARSLYASGRYLMATLNNESAELNEYRIRRFALRDVFHVFLSSCYLGARKPAEAIYRRALQLVQREPDRCVFIDDRPLNLECAARQGLHTIHFRDAEALRADLQHLGVSVCAQPVNTGT
jgi:putative hydrolase of the HAD superfamily